jgi:hypothetical protein
MGEFPATLPDAGQNRPERSTHVLGGGTLGLLERGNRIRQISPIGCNIIKILLLYLF